MQAACSGPPMSAYANGAVQGDCETVCLVGRSSKEHAGVTVGLGGAGS